MGTYTDLSIAPRQYCTSSVTQTRKWTEKMNRVKTKPSRGYLLSSKHKRYCNFALKLWIDPHIMVWLPPPPPTTPRGVTATLYKALPTTNLWHDLNTQLERNHLSWMIPAAFSLSVTSLTAACIARFWSGKWCALAAVPVPVSHASAS